MYKYAKHQDPDFLEVLKRVASHSSINNRHAAAIIHNEKYTLNKRFIGFNKFINVKNKDYLKTIHAELDVVYRYKKLLRGADILVVRVNKSNNLRNSRPCNHCISTLCKLGIRKVYYSNDNGDIVYEFVQDMPFLHTSSAHKIEC